MTDTAAIINPPKTHNQPPEPTPFELITEEINDLYDTAKDFCDGQAIDTQEMHDTIEKIHTALHEAGKRAEAARVEEKAPLDVQIAAIQDRYNTLIGDTKKVKGKVPLGKEALSALMLPWRRKVQEEKAAVAEAACKEAERLAEEARAALQASQGNLAAREDAELLVKEAAAVDRFAKQQTKGPTGLRSVWRAELVDEGAALDWCFARDPDAFKALCQSAADATVRAGMRMVPGFRVWEDKVAM